MPNIKRPLSPHLSIYRPQITSTLSIFHRITGVALYFGLILLAVFLHVVAYSPENYAALHQCLSSAIGRLFLFGWTLAFYYHLFNGVRHLYWDMGKGFDMASVNRTGWIAIILSILSSIITWFAAYHNAGVL